MNKREISRFLILLFSSAFISLIHRFLLENDQRRIFFLFFSVFLWSFSSKNAFYIYRRLQNEEIQDVYPPRPSKKSV